MAATYVQDLRYGATFNNNLSTTSATGTETNPIVQHQNHGDVSRPQQGVERQTWRTRYQLEDTQAFRRILPTDVLGLVLQNVSWINSVLFPIEFNENLVFITRKITLSAPLPDEVPSLAVPRVMSRSSTSRSVRSVAYGIAMHFENNRLRTPEGQEDFQLAFAQLVNVLKQHAAHDALSALMNPDPEEKAYNTMYRPISGPEQFLLATDREVREFGCVMKSQMGIVKIVQEYADRIKTLTGLEPNVMVGDRSINAFCRLDLPILNQYWLAGPLGPSRLINAERSLGTFPGTQLQLYSIPQYQPELDENPAYPSMAISTRTTGSFFVMKNLYLHVPAPEYRTEFRDLMVWNETMDTFTLVKFFDAIMECGRFDAKGRLNAAHERVAQAGNDDMFIYTASGEFHGDVAKRVARCFGLMEPKYLKSDALHGTALTAVKNLSEAHQRAIANGVARYNELYDLGNANASFLGLYNDAADLRSAAFIPAWRALYRLLFARLGGATNPALDPAKCPVWFHALPVDDRGMAVLFEMAIARPTAIQASANAEASLTISHMDNRAGVVDFDMRAAMHDLRQALDADNTANPAGALNVAVVTQPIEELLDALDSPRLKLLFAYYIAKLARRQVDIAPAPGQAAVRVELRQGVNAWHTFITTHQTAAGAATLEHELIKELLRYDVGLPQPMQDRLATFNTRYANPDARAEFDEADKGTQGQVFTARSGAVPGGRYLTPESGYTASAPWTGALPVPVGPRDVFPGLADDALYFYDAEGMAQDADEDRATKRGRRDEEYEETDDKDMYHKTHASYPFLQKQWITHHQRAQEQESDAWVLAARVAFLAAPIHERVFRALCQFGVMVPFDVMLWRAWMRHAMSSIWIAVGGAATGKTYYGHFQCTAGVDPFNNSTAVNSTWRLATVIEKPQNIACIAHCKYEAYLGGGGTKFYGQRDLEQLAANNWKATVRDSPDIVSMLMPMGVDYDVRDMDITGDYDPEFRSPARGSHYPTWALEREMRRLENMECPWTGRPDSWRGRRGAFNRLCYQGTQYAVVNTPGKFESYTPNRGHHDVDYPGVGKVRRGIAGVSKPELVRQSM